MQPFPGRGIFFLVRHGETDWNRDRRVMGRLGIPLNATGRGQVARLVPLLAPLGATAVWTGPLARARETAEQIASGLGGLPIHVDDGLTEVAYGAWEGRTFAELVDDPAYLAHHRDPERVAAPGGEALAAVRARVLAALGRIAAAAPGGRSIVVSHGDPIRIALAASLGLPPAEMRRLRVDTAAVSAIETTGDWAEVKFLNARADLGQLIATSHEALAREAPAGPAR